VVELGLSGADDSVVRDVAIRQESILVTLDADFANVLRFPPADTPGLCASASIQPSRRLSTPLFGWRSPVWPR
jgi:hypothetical protein